MGDSSSSSCPASYIHMVQHLIEKCLIFHMTKEECMEALSKHANINPIITSTVWKELEKENKEFFEAYMKSKAKDDRMSQEETNQIIQKMISESDSSKR
ncbi:hypothetical protein AAZX31_20G225600 [Glycine max]|uniref:Angiotensin-converting enzyme 2 n=2 Tax=Glycine subgen. Soja TaxID=1462606 RepID=I1NJ57_SOYBN|nr:uncharacterized protein LOC100800093 [Glycine max]XP_028219654.1 uncharacterized protein LOC114401347 [Glycine soja]KAG4911303.1 hypothetical protein JHK87_057419 [Glycine soja]KAG4919890.1 hypothetical protein JHK85_058171 [Glycine max]KRG92960.1 hypothetical protein GLYMA_20G240100v4 [Glycine max]RZB45529.1 hypothetical protein D0Y65_055034 [Glycine soja]|eukprot:XP_003555622.1 uncharacterized protein LOC100800093 [Glycine max]